MSDDEEDMFSDSSSETDQSINQLNQDLVTDTSVVILETSPIVQRSQRPVPSHRSRNLSNSVILLDSSDGEEGSSEQQVMDTLNRISQLNEETDEMQQQIDNHIRTVSRQISSGSARDPQSTTTTASAGASSESGQNVEMDADLPPVPGSASGNAPLPAASTSTSAGLTAVMPPPNSASTSSESLVGPPTSSLPATSQPQNSVASNGATNVTAANVDSTGSLSVMETGDSSSLTVAVAASSGAAVVASSGATAVASSGAATTASRTEVSPYFPPPSATSRGLNASSAEFQDPGESPEIKTEKKGKKKKTKKRKATNSIDDDNDEGSCCTICFEAWSNSGDHRIASLKCGHFFGYTCIEKWLRGQGSSCPNCNEKSTKKDIRVHYVAKLKAIDTSEKDRALADLEKEKTSNRELQLRLTEYQVRNRLFQEEIDKLQRELHQYRKFRGDLPAALQSSQPAAVPTQPTRLVYQRRYEIVRGNEKSCRVLAYSEYLGMLLISQPSFTALAPGYGVRQFNVLDMKVGNFISLCKDQIRDLSFSRVSPHLLLSCGHDRAVRITNISNGNKIVEFGLEHQVWACDWAANNDYQIFLGTNKGCILIHDTRDPGGAPQILNFPTRETKPIIGLRSVPARPEAGFPQPGFLVMNLTSVWYWYTDSQENNTWACCKLNIEQRLLWSLDFEPESFLVLIGCKPCPLASHLVLELTSTQIDSGRTYIARSIMTGKGGSYNQRSFLRSSLLPSPNGQVYLAFSKGTGQNDHKVVIQEVGSDRVTQELKVDRPIIDIKHMKLNDERYLALLGETELTVYKWNQV